jgi:aspartate/methionine/tyrosine aminotransferase
MNANSEQTKTRSIDDILKLEAKYKLEFGCKPFNLSLWDASKSFQSSLLEKIQLSNFENIMNYEFSDLLTCRKGIVKRLGYKTSINDCLITPTGSISISCVLNWLQKIGIRKIHVLCPCYYTIIPLSKQFGIKTQKVFLTKSDKGFDLSKENMNILASSKAIWLNNPLYCTGLTLQEETIEFLRDFLESGGIVISDECIAPLGTELGRKLGNYSLYIGIHCPHKLLLMNSLKFSAIVFNIEHQNFFKYWSDIVYGSLLTSNIIAIEHFLSENYDLLYKKSLTMIMRSLKNVINAFMPFETLFVFEESSGFLISGYIPFIKASICDNKEFLWNAFKNSGTSFIPGTRHFFNPNADFSFKINLARDDDIFRVSLNRLLNYLAQNTSITIPFRR